MSATIELRGVSKWYGYVLGVNDVTLDIEPGVTGLLGPNGAGKSTMLHLIAGVLSPSLGEVKVLGRAPAESPAARAGLGYAPAQDGFYEEMPAREFVYSMARLSGLSGVHAKQRTAAVLEDVGMTELAWKPLRACSKGMRQRIKVAQALIHEPPVLVLDEPLTGIDPAGRQDLLALFQRLGADGRTVLVSSHILHEIEVITNRVVLMARGRLLAAGTLGKIRDLLDQHPLTVRISSSRARSLARELLAREEVVGVVVGDGEEDLTVKVRRPEAFFRSLPEVVLREGGEVERVEPLDESAEAIFDYLVGGAAPSPADRGAPRT